jgi:ribonuclease-3
LIDNAFYHSSYVNENPQLPDDNERLEYMGDAVLELWVTDKLFHLEPPVDEGQMTTMRAQLVCEKTLAEAARELGLDQCLKLGVGEEKTGGRQRDSLISDSFEAFLGALYLDGGMDEAIKILQISIGPRIIHPESQNVIDYKTRLQEYVQADTRRVLTYKVISESGPSNNPVFEIGVYMDGICMGTGIGTSKKRAEQQAACEALKLVVK